MIPKSESKHKALAKLTEDASDAFSKYIRLRDCLKTTEGTRFGLCITCGRRETRQALHAGHYPAGRGNNIIFSEMGTNAQCNICNTTLGGRPKEYRAELVRRFGEGPVKQLEMEAKQVKKYTRDELIGVKTLYRKKYKELLDSEGEWT